jgi:hypothetical protein
VGAALDFFKSIALVGPVTEENASTIRTTWLLGHISRVLLTLAIPVYALRALAAGPTR